MACATVAFRCSECKCGKPQMFRYLCFVIAFTFVAPAHAQRPEIFPDCQKGTPIPFNVDGKWGYLTTSGIVVPPQFKSAGPFSDGLASACISEGCGLIDLRGQFVTPVRDPRKVLVADRYSQGIGPVERDGKWGYADVSANLVIPMQFHFAGDFDETGIARVSLGGKFFFIDRTGERITPEFDGAFDFSENLAAVVVGDRVGYIRRDGRFALPPNHRGASGIDFSEGLVAVRIAGKVGFMDTSGSIIVKPFYDDAFPFSEGLASVMIRDRWGYIDKTGKVVVPLQYRVAHMFIEGVASVLNDSGKWGYIDKTGVFAIQPLYNAAMPFCAGVAQVETSHLIGSSRRSRTARYKGKHGFIEHSGEYVWRDSKDQLWQSSCR
jgi:hypothetical protein